MFRSSTSSSISASCSCGRRRSSTPSPRTSSTRTPARHRAPSVDVSARPPSHPPSHPLPSQELPVPAWSKLDLKPELPDPSGPQRSLPGCSEVRKVWSCDRFPGSWSCGHDDVNKPEQGHAQKPLLSVTEGGVGLCAVASGVTWMWICRWSPTQPTANTRTGLWVGPAPPNSPHTNTARTNQTPATVKPYGLDNCQKETNARSFSFTLHTSVFSTTVSCQKNVPGVDVQS